jgi:hypothetical protein
MLLFMLLFHCYYAAVLLLYGDYVIVLLFCCNWLLVSHHRATIQETFVCPVTPVTTAGFFLTANGKTIFVTVIGLSLFCFIFASFICSFDYNIYLCVYCCLFLSVNSITSQFSQSEFDWAFLFSGYWNSYHYCLRYCWRNQFCLFSVLFFCCCICLFSNFSFLLLWLLLLMLLLLLSVVNVI